MSTALQFLFARVPAAKEFFAVCLLNLFLFVQLVSFCEVVVTSAEAGGGTSTYYSQHHNLKTVPSEKQTQAEKLFVLAVLTNRMALVEQPSSICIEQSQASFFLSDQCNSSLLKGRAPPVA